MALTCIPIVDIHAENITENWPSLILAIKSATFIALDLVRIAQHSQYCGSSYPKLSVCSIWLKLEFLRSTNII